uniref:Uncharacterized protein n=1 Tax=Magnetococcus massalia (strain MO-1) TaxID=451514 RepID=A0A1S7LNJ0_MAGMO|nr:Protein of unknown function [Candidatus Magnetococcus massalia]
MIKAPCRANHHMVVRQFKYLPSMEGEPFFSSGWPDPLYFLKRTLAVKIRPKATTPHVQVWLGFKSDSPTRFHAGGWWMAR